MEKVDKSKVLEFIKASKIPVGKKEIVASTGYRGDFAWCMKTLMQEYPQIKRTGNTRNVYYIWEEPETLTADQGDYSEMKNQEGYPDGTAGRAIANVMKSSGRYPMRQRFGEVWSTSNVNDDMEGLLVISAKEGMCICYNVYPSKKAFMKESSTFKWADDKGKHYISAMSPVNVQERKLGKKLFEISAAEKDCLKEFVRAALDISPVVETVGTIPIEVPVEKTVPDPKDKRMIEQLEARIDDLKARLDTTAVKNLELKEENNMLKASIAVPGAVTTVEYRTDPKEIELAVLKAKCEIYEKLIFSDSNVAVHIRKEFKQA